MILYLLGRRLKQPIFEQLRGGLRSLDPRGASVLNPLLDRGNNVDHVSACSFGRHDWKILHVVLTLQPSKSRMFFLKEVDCH